jgi:hypothetical protein
MVARPRNHLKSSFCQSIISGDNASVALPSLAIEVLAAHSPYLGPMNSPKCLRRNIEARRGTSARSQACGPAPSFAWFLFLTPCSRSQRADLRCRHVDFGTIGTGDIPPVRGSGHAILKAALETAWTAGCYQVTLMTVAKMKARYCFTRKPGLNAAARQRFRFDGISDTHHRSFFRSIFVTILHRSMRYFSDLPQGRATTARR